MKKLNHPNLVKLYEVLDVPKQDNLYMVLEFCKGGSLMQLQPGQTVEPVSEDQARHFFRQIILAVEYLHENDIAHCDLKPDNILIMEDKRTCKICDFGVSEMFAKHGDDSTRKSNGSPAFMAPELCISHPDGIHAYRSDIWALGCTLYCMVRGQVPFAGESVLELYENIQHKPVEIPKTLSENLKVLLTRLLEKDPEKRVTLDEIREDPWVTRDGLDPLIIKAENVEGISYPTQEEIDQAVKSINTLFSIAKFAGKFKKRLNERRSMSQAEVQALVQSPRTTMDIHPSPPQTPKVTIPNLAELAGKLDGAKQRVGSPSNLPTPQEEADEDGTLPDVAVQTSEPEGMDTAESRDSDK